jgi:hypothetical protein
MVAFAIINQIIVIMLWLLAYSSFQQNDFYHYFILKHLLWPIKCHKHMTKISYNL